MCLSTYCRMESEFTLDNRQSNKKEIKEHVFVRQAKRIYFACVIYLAVASRIEPN